MTRSSYHLPPAPNWSARARRAFLDVARALSGGDEDATRIAIAKQAALRLPDAGLSAAIHVITDLTLQGWCVGVEATGKVVVTPPEADPDPMAEKARVRRQELIKRDEQLSSASVSRFIVDMERPREFNRHFVSIFSLMRDGPDLAERLHRLSTQAEADPSILQTAVDPYVQIVHTGERCTHTGLRLVDIWRYFRHTWITQYTSVPGRSMLVLVRDRAAAFHPVIGIAALGSAIVQLAERDEWIGWQPDSFIAALSDAPTLRMARWVTMRLEQTLGELYVDDLLADGLYWPTLWNAPTDDAIDRLRKEADARRRDHHRFVRRSEFKKSPTDESGWRERAESDLFRSKRCLALADVLRAKLDLAPFLYPQPTRIGLKNALDDAAARRAIRSVLRRAKAEAVGTEIADLSVCGAVAPYNSILGGKLVSMLAVSPEIVRAYHDRYRDYASEIASSMAGRPIRRRSHLTFVGTTSLFGSGSSQYNRVSISKLVLGGKSDIVFQRIGRSRSFGTSHLSRASLDALARFAEQSRAGIRVNSIFGEGVNPKLRKVRSGLDLLGWPSAELLQHRRPRIVFGISLVENLLPYLLGLDKQPRYRFPRGNRNSVEQITRWWYQRWLAARVKSPEVLARVADNSLTRPPRHGARVPDPARPSQDAFDC
jgi:hypothetical protein